jgi:hypothetical protein
MDDNSPEVFEIIQEQMIKFNIHFSKFYNMNKVLNTAILIISGILSCLLLGNLLVHLPFYFIDGSLVKLLSPIWMYLNGIALCLCIVFIFTLRRRKMVAH